MIRLFILIDVNPGSKKYSVICNHYMSTKNPAQKMH